jgi:ABC-type lipoprotein release transport system permease subunit
VVEGRYLELTDRLHAYIGRRLADRLELEVGSRLVLTAQDASGEIAGQFVRVVGIFQSGLPEVDEGVVQIPLSTARAWMQVGDGATTIAVLLDSGWDVPGVLRRLRRAVADGPGGLTVLGWREAMPELDAAIKIDDFGGFVFQAILFAIIALAIVNTVLMSVMYRTREFGVLRALGLTKAQTAALVFSEGVFLTVVSGVLGMVFGFAVTWLFFRNGLDYSFAMKGDLTFSGVVLDPVIIPALRFTQVVLSLGSILVVGILASFYPAFRATRIDVAEAMKFEA